MYRNIVITEKPIADLIDHDGKGKRFHSATIIAERDVDISLVIFKVETNFTDEKGPSAKDLTNNLRVWFKIILGCINHMPSTNSYDYINTRQKIMLFLLKKGVKLGLPSLLFKFINSSIRESITGGSSNKARSKFISNVRLFSDVLVESGMMDDLLVSGLTKELVKDVGKVFWGKNLKSMGLISKFQRLEIVLTKDDIRGTRNPIDDYPIFAKVDSPKVLMAYLESCLKDGVDPLVDTFNLPKTYPKGRKGLEVKDPPELRRRRRRYLSE